MHAGLDLDLGLGSHAGHGTRHGPKSVLVFQVDGEQSAARKTRGVQFNVTSFAPGELIIF
jgi:hypothetical protein